MTRFYVSRLLFAISISTALAAGQKITVPLHDPSRPAQIHANVLNGGITVKAYDGRDVLVETAAGATVPERDEPAQARGMHRLVVPGNAGLDVIEEDNVVTIKTERSGGGAQVTVTVPRRSSVQLKSLNGGDLTVEGVNGEIEANNLNGRIILRNVSGSVVAHSLNGEVLATIDRPDPSKPMSFSSLNGNIDVTLPDDVKANFKMKTAHGEVYSDFEVKLASNAPTPVPDPDERKNGRFRVRVDSSMHGSVNGGGPEYQFTTFNGQIYIRKKK